MQGDPQGHYRLRHLLKALDLRKSTYEFHAKRLREGDRPESEETAKIREVFEKSKGRYGFRRVAAALRNEGMKINHKKVRRIMRELGLKGKSVKRRRKYSSYQGTVGKVADNILNRNFDVQTPNMAFVTDVTEFAFDWGKVYLSPVMDLCNRQIIGYDISRRPNFDQIKNMMSSAFEGRKIADGALFHSDQGWQYQMKEFQEMLSGLRLTQSMSRKGNCHDNAVMENFFGRLKVEMFYGEEKTFRNYEDFRKALEEYILWYNQERIKEYLKWKSPCQALSIPSTL